MADEGGISAERVARANGAALGSGTRQADGQRREQTPPELAAQIGRLVRAGKFAEADKLISTGLANDPSDGNLWIARGAGLAAMRRYTEAVWCYRRALSLDPQASAAWTNLGNTLTALKQPKTAVACHEQAIAHTGGNALLYRNLGSSLVAADRYGDAIVAYSRALERQPDYHMARWDRALAYLYLGNYQKGWPDYEARLVTGQLPERSLPGQKWDGKPYAGKRLLVLSEQGFGDALWVARYFSRVKALGGELILECRPELKPLFETTGIADRIILRGETLPSADLHVHQCSLPGLFTPDVGSIPAPPFVVVPDDRIAKLRPVFKGAANRLKVGIVWSGSTTFKRNADRAQPLSRFVQALAMPGVQLYSLQKGPPTKELTAAPNGAVIDLAPHLQDFADTAAAVAQLDLVIMTDSAVAHLAGAMGKRVWLLLGHLPHWLWLLNRADNPWYPSIRLFRPRGEGDWAHVFDMAAAELMRLAAKV